MAGPWEKYGAAPAPAQGGPAPMTFGTPNPYKAQAQQQDLTKGSIDIQRGQNDLATAPFDAQKAEADARKAQLELQALEKRAADPTGALGVEQAKATGFYSRAIKANGDYEKMGVGAQGFGDTVAKAVTPDSLEGYTVSPERQRADAVVRGFIAAALRYESGAAIPPEEFESAYLQYFPQPGEGPETAAVKAKLRANTIAGLKLGAGPGAQQVEPVNVQETENLAPSTSGTQAVDNPALSGVRGEYLKRLSAGQSGTQIVSFLRQAGITDPKILQSAVEQVKFRKAHPEAPIEGYATSVMDDMDVPLSPVEGAMNDAAQTGLGAYAMRAGNAVTGNNLDSIVGATGGNAERANIALNDAGNAHPIASFAGDLSGGVMAALSGEAGLARAGMAPGVGRALAADTGYGAVAGAGASDDGNRLGGAALGAAAGLGGSLAGQGIARAAGNAISPKGGGLDQLYDAGVRPTPGQRFVNGGIVGRTVNAAEEGLQSVPLVGSAIRGAREDARDQFQIGAFNEALKEVGAKLPKGMKPGTSPHAFAQQVFDRVYNKAREGLRVEGDDIMAKEVQELGGSIQNLAEPSAKRFNSILENVIMRRIQGNAFEGPVYKRIQIDLGKTIRGIRKNPSGDGELADALEDMQSILDSAARRHSEPEAVKLLDDADRGYAKFVRIEEAAKARGGDPGTFSPTQFDRAIQKEARGPRSQEYLRGEALMQDYAEQGKTLVDRMPNSGSADRAIIGLIASGSAGYAEPTSLTLLGALGLAYAPGARKALAGTMKPKPQNKLLADEIRKRARIAGASGAVMGTSPDQ